MNRSLIHMPRRLFIAAALAGLGTLAMAQGAAPAPDASAPARPVTMRHHRVAPEQWQERMAQRRATHMADLKAALAITPEQESAWNQFEAACQPPALSQRPEPGQWAKLTAPERIDRMEQRMADRQQHFKQMGEAVKTLYAQLTPAQQKTFDERAMHAWAMHGEPGRFGLHGRPGMTKEPGMVRHHLLNRPAAPASQTN